MEHGLGILVVDAHHVVHVVFHGIRAGPFVKDGVHIGAVKIVILDILQEIVLVPVIEEFQPPKVLVILTVLEVVHDEDVVAPLSVEFFDEIAADEAGAAGYDDHALRSFRVRAIHWRQIARENQ